MKKEYEVTSITLSTRKKSIPFYSNFLFFISTCGDNKECWVFKGKMECATAAGVTTEADFLLHAFEEAWLYGQPFAHDKFADKTTRSKRLPYNFLPKKVKKDYLGIMEIDFMDKNFDLENKKGVNLNKLINKEG